MEPIPRPSQAGSWADRVRGWVVWFGVGRLVAASVSVAMVLAGGVWLIRNPAPSTEASLPFATTSVPASDDPSSSAADASPEAAGAPIAETAGPTTTVPTSILVHVAGAVVEPGVYRLDADARIQAALAAAGGPLVEADWNALNLAAPLADGMRVYVPLIGEESPGELVSGGVPVAGAAGSGDVGSATPAGPIDINRADAPALEGLPGVGPATAAAIVAERERNGPFASPDDLERVRGIGPAKVEALRDLVTT